MQDPRKLRHYALPRLKKRSFFSSLSATKWLIIINIVFFAVTFPLILFKEGAIGYLALQPASFTNGYFWTLLTSMFMHGNFLHLLINMFVLFSLGSLCEKIIGRKRFLAFYLISGIIASLVFVFFAYLFGSVDPASLSARIFSSPLAYAVGSSGAIFAIAGLFMILTPKLKFMIIFLPFFSLPAYIMIPLVLFVTWIISSSIGIGIGNTAHLGGFLVGLFYALYLRKKYKRKTKLISEYYSG